MKNYKIKKIDLNIIQIIKGLSRRLLTIDFNIRKFFDLNLDKKRQKKFKLFSMKQKYVFKNNSFKKAIIFLKRAKRLIFINLFNILFAPFSFFKFLLFSKKLLKIRQIFLLIIFSLMLSFVVFIYLFFKNLPDIKQLKERKYPMTTKILDRKGRLLYKIYKNQNRTLINLKDLPIFVKQATIAIEDKTFYKHFGISPRGVIRAFIENKKEGETVQGGSTITQQLVKNALLSPERTLDRKIKEAILSVMVERNFTKDEILEMYLNEVPYGGIAYGIEEAAQMYFGKSAKNLTLAQTAFLAGLPASPTDYSPFGSNPEKAKKRQIEVLDNMLSMKFITKKQAEQAKNEKLIIQKQDIKIKAPHFVFFVKQELEKKYGTEFIDQGGLIITTTLDLDIQNMLEKEVKEGVDKQKYLLVGNGAAMIQNPQTGEILAMVGSRDYFDTENDGNVNVAISPRQPGSSIKPITYALALSSGLYTPSTIIDDSPVTYHAPGSLPYSPVNYDGKFHGKVTIRTALACSYNVPIVKILSTLGVSRLIDLGEKMGITTWTDRSRFGYSLTLGGGEVKLIDMMKVFSIFANNGKKVDQKYVLTIKDPKGKIIENNDKLDSEQILSPIVAFQISDILSDNNARTPAFGPASSLVIPGHVVSVKTGTTDSKKDNWTIGYTSEFVVGVWIGNNNNKPMSYALESGNTGAAAIWNSIMKNLLKNRKTEKIISPQELIQVDICRETGTLPCQGCTIQKEYFIRGSEPKERCEKIEPTKEATTTP